MAPCLRSLFVGALVVVLGGCGETTMTGARGRPTTARRAPESLGPAVVAAGTEFVVTLDHDLATASLEVDQPVVAHVNAAVRGPEGTLAVDQGALLRGRVAHVARGGRPSVSIDFETIETIRGPVPVHLTLRAVPDHAWLAIGAPGEGRDAVLFLRDGAPPGAVGGGPRGEEGAQGELRVPQGTRLRLQITAPLRVPEE